MDRDSIYLAEITEFCNKIIGFSSAISYEVFLKDEKLQLALVKLIENIGESAKRLSDTTRSNNPNVDWKKAMAMRDKLVHDYMDVDLEIVYDVATREIPALLKGLEKK